MIQRYLSPLRRLLGRGTSDPHFPGLTRERADLLRAEIRNVLQEGGATVRFDGTFAIVEHPQYGQATANLVDLISDVAQSQHPQALPTLTRTFVDNVILAALRAPAAMDVEAADLYAGLRLRVVRNTHALPEQSQIIAAATLHAYTEDTAVVLALDSEHSIYTMSLERLARVDDLDTLVRAGRNNLREELQGAEVRIQFHPGSEKHPGSSFHSVESDNFYLSSAVLLMEEMLDQWVPELDRSHGVLFAIPTRHVLLVRAITTGDDLVEGIGRMASFSAQVAYDSPYALSPLLHVWRDGEVSTVSSLDEEAGTLTITPTPYLLELLGEGLSDEGN